MYTLLTRRRPNFGRCLKQFIEYAGLVRPGHPLAGCSDDAIDMAMRAQQVERLPLVYRSFLTHLGAEAGKPFQEWLYTCDYLTRIRDYLVEALTEEQVSVPLPATTFLFANSFGDYLFFNTADGDDPPVYCLFIDVDSARIERVHPRLSTWLQRIITRSAISAARRVRREKLHALKLWYRNRPLRRTPMSPLYPPGALYWVTLHAAPGEADRIPHPHVIVEVQADADDALMLTLCALTSNLTRLTIPGNILLQPPEGGLTRHSVVEVGKVVTLLASALGVYIGSLTPERVEQIRAGMRFQGRIAAD